jgi:hypothetical protein
VTHPPAGYLNFFIRDRYPHPVWQLRTGQFAQRSLLEIEKPNSGWAVTSFFLIAASLFLGIFLNPERQFELFHGVCFLIIVNGIS